MKWIKRIKKKIRTGLTIICIERIPSTVKYRRYKISLSDGQVFNLALNKKKSKKMDMFLSLTRLRLEMEEKKITD